MSNLEERIDRLESLDQIRQLASKYAVSLDMRALDMHVNLFVPDVKVGKSDQGRQALKAWADKTFRDQFKGTSHHIGNHIIEFLDSDNAIGLVYSKNEHETNDEWVIMQMLYWDVYARVDGEWLFKKRLPMYWYATDLNKPPLERTKCDGLIRSLMRVIFMIYFQHGKNSGKKITIDTVMCKHPLRLTNF